MKGEHVNRAGMCDDARQCNTIMSQDCPLQSVSNQQREKVNQRAKVSVLPPPDQILQMGVTPVRQGLERRSRLRNEVVWICNQDDITLAESAGGRLVLLRGIDVSIARRQQGRASSVRVRGGGRGCINTASGSSRQNQRTKFRADLKQLEGGALTMSRTVYVDAKLADA